MTRALLTALAAAAIFSFFFVPTFVVVSRGLLQQGLAPVSLDQLDAPAQPTASVATTSRPAISFAAAASSTVPAGGIGNTVTIGGKNFIAEIADTDAARELGLSKRANLPANAVMLFVFAGPSNWGFWMKDTLFPLDMIWLDSTGKVVYIQQNVLPSTYPAIFAPPASSPALYVIEANAGTAASLNVKVGSTISLPSGIYTQSGIMAQ